MKKNPKMNNLLIAGGVGLGLYFIYQRIAAKAQQEQERKNALVRAIMDKPNLTTAAHVADYVTAQSVTAPPTGQSPMVDMGKIAALKQMQANQQANVLAQGPNGSPKITAEDATDQAGPGWTYLPPKPSSGSSSSVRDLQSLADYRRGLGPVWG